MQILFILLCNYNIVTSSLFVDPKNKHCLEYPFSDIDLSSARDNISLPFCSFRWAAKYVQCGETIFLREGRHLCDRCGLALNTTLCNEDRMIRITSYMNENVVVTGFYNISLLGEPVYLGDEVYEYDVSNDISTMAIVRQDGKILQSPIDFTQECKKSYITSRGQFCKNHTKKKIYIRSFDGTNPSNSSSHYTEYSNSFSVVAIKSYVKHLKYVKLDNFRIEGGFYSLFIAADHIHVSNMTILSTFGTGIHVHSGDPQLHDGIIGSYNITFINNDIFDFGASGITISGGVNVLIRNNHIHDSNSVHGGNYCFDGFCSRSTALMLKHGCRNLIVEKNMIYSIRSVYGFIGMGGESATMTQDFYEAYNLTIRNNIFYNNTGRYKLILVSGCNNCTFVNNIVYESTGYFSHGCYNIIFYKAVRTLYNNKNVSFYNNVFMRNNMHKGCSSSINKHIVFNDDNDYEYMNFIFDYNVISHESYVVDLMEDVTVNLSIAQNHYGFEVNSLGIIDEYLLSFYLNNLSPIDF